MDRPPIPRRRRDQRRFLDWLGRRRADRPFFAYPELFRRPRSVHPPAGVRGPLRHPARRSRRITSSWWITSARRRSAVSRRSIIMARDCYDDCIAYLDDQLGRLLDELEAPGPARRHGRDHHVGPRRGVRRAWHARPRQQRPMHRRDPGPAGDPLPGRAGGPR